MNRVEKREEIELLSGYLNKAQIALCADYRGLTVGQITELRRSLRKVGSVGRVVKNTLAKLSIESAYKNSDLEEVKKFQGIFEGPSLLVVSNEDPVSPSKVLAEFGKIYKPFQIKGGWFEGGFVDQGGVQALAMLPSREELLAQLLRLINAPATQVVRLMQAPASQMVQLLEAYRQKMSEAA